MEELWYTGVCISSGACILGGSWVVISRVISRVTIIITFFRLLITPLTTTHEPARGMIEGLH